MPARPLLAKPRASASPWRKADERERDRALKREAVLVRAVEYFNERGFHATSLDDVALSLNVTKPTIYHYFGNKDEILFECVRRGLVDIQEAAQAAEAAGGNGLERLTALLTDYAVMMSDGFGACVARTSDHALSPESLKRIKALKRDTDAVVRRVIEAGIADGSIAPGDVRLMTFTALGALNSISRWYDPAGPKTKEEIASACVATLVKGFAARNEPSGRD
ncbi:TetR/AcrR family transcriptional regulator [Tianweitania sediminis]|jgi:AcrR family transcriptional regulator|uniref:TetR family transcriptional regulator n=1 Tax=Tianweitania sediminis TaxID=1502156 RepID=A0A8J7R4S9_9HYPH|nr:TetR/AcrR family transcriptional regulator [Tianweitania sediminis]MBP0441208.1 TetR family transcriptional regulator [Tianweitania sediminis]HEV7416621.1 TetR/AcrR family transcriptional regulator [Tianweitania sediminis]